ncbi:MAG TPA: hypothetical protein VIM29_09840 [Bacillota bacterium]
MNKKRFLASLLIMAILGIQIINPCIDAWVGENSTPDEGVIQTLLQKTLVTKMIFEGGNENWSCTYKVVDTIIKSGVVVEPVPNKFVLIPKLLENAYYDYTRKFSFFVSYSKAQFSGEHWLKTGEEFIVESNAPAPDPRESIQVKVVEWGKEEQFILVNIIPANAITPETALRKALEVYYRTYGIYPTADFTFTIEYYDQQYWLVSYDDNDGIGGKGVLLVDAFTGEPGEIKEDE